METLRKRTMGGIALPPGAMTDGSNAVALDVLFSSNGGEQLCVIHGQENWPDSGWTPIGIVVVPGTHDRYGDGSCGIMSLVGMDYGHPESGTPITSASQIDNVGMCWGSSEASIDNSMFVSTTALTMLYNYIPYQTSAASTACTITYGNTVWPYAGTTTAPTSAASTTYSNTGGYVQATTGKTGCDFNGIRNTVACYVKTRTAAQWTASTVENAYGTTNTPAAACCGRFKTIGTKSFLDVFSGITSNDLSYGTSASTKNNKGFWYLPGAGELCYIPSKRFEIYKTIAALNKKYGNVCGQLNTSSVYWSSSEYNGNGQAWRV